MPYISENGQTRFVSQAEFDAWNKAQGLTAGESLRAERRARSAAADANDKRAPAGGTVTDLSSPNNGLSGKERRALVAQQQAKVSGELENIGTKLAQARTGQIRLSPDEVARLEARQSRLADNFNQLENGQPITDGSIEGGRVGEQILFPNTTNSSPDQTLPTTSEKTANPTANDGVGYIPPEDDFIGRVAVGQQPGVPAYARSPEVNTVAQDYEIRTIDLTDPDANRGQGFVPYRGEVVEEFPYGGSAAAALTGPRATEPAGGSSYYPVQGAAGNPFAVPAPEDQDQGNSSYYPVQGVGGNPFATQLVPEDQDQGNSSYYPSQTSTNPFAAQQLATAPSPTNASDYYPTGQGQQGNPFANPRYTDDIAAKVTQLKAQNAIRSQRSAFNEKDWRVRLALAPQAQYLYNVAVPGDLLYPLLGKGVIFPYTPQITTAYRANYETYDLTHSNIRGYFYKNSSPQELQITGTFTAQDTAEANYLLAVIHFFKAATKMFYGQDAQNGAPPPALYLSGYGIYGFNEHPVLLSNFNYNLPNDVDYIRARSENINGTDLVVRRPKTPSPPSSSPVFSAVSRLKSIFMPKGGEPKQKASQPFDTSGQAVGDIGGESPTYVPTQMEIQLTLLPLQSRSQTSQQFSLTQFAQGSLLKGGFW